MTVFAIDPGTNESAFVRWDGERIVAAEIQANHSLLDGLKSVGHVSADIYVIEMVACYGMAVGKEVFETCVWIGRFHEAIERSYGRRPKLVYRQQIKLYHCQSPRAKDANIRQALIDKYGAPGTKKNPGTTYGLKSHLWAAFALATYISEVPNGN